MKRPPANEKERAARSATVMEKEKSMRNLVGNIKASYETRASGIAKLRETVAADIGTARTRLGELSRSRQGMARQLRADEGRRHAVRAKAEAQRKSSADAWLKDAGEARHAMAKAIRKDLARTHSSRVRAEAERSSATQDFLKSTAAGRQGMADSLKASLDKSHSERARAEVGRKSETETELERIASLRKENARHLRSSLSKGRSDMAKAADQERSKNRSWLNAIAGKHAEDRAAWQEMASNLSSLRSKGRTPTQDVEGGGRPRVDLGALSDAVFERIADQPGGIRLAEMEQEFGISRFQIDKALKSLMERGKVEKRDRLYFAI